MTKREFEESRATGIIPGELNPWLRALWYDAQGDWDAAHEQIQHLPDTNASWIHAYLHRKEGDIFNADYWYRRANRKRPAQSLQEEWETILNALISNSA